jgi:hypothetical protein
MNKKFWASVRENNFEIPTGHSVQALTEELFSYIGSTDPELRDTIGLEAFYNWLKQGLYSADDLRGYITRLVANLQKGIGKTEDDSVFLRSFSALWLSLIIQNDNETPVLIKEDVIRILVAALAHFSAETDLRGYVQIKGYAHAIAHASDLLGALGHSQHVDTNDHIKILNCIADKLRGVTDWIFFYNEDSRIARTILEIFVCNTLTLDQIKDWLTSLSRNWNGAWRNEGEARAYSNGRNLLRALHWQILTWKGKQIPNKEIILKLGQETLEQAKPWEWTEA